MPTDDLFPDEATMNEILRVVRASESPEGAKAALSAVTQEAVLAYLDGSASVEQARVVKDALAVSADFRTGVAKLRAELDTLDATAGEVNAIERLLEDVRTREVLEEEVFATRFREPVLETADVSWPRQPARAAPDEAAARKTTRDGILGRIAAWFWRPQVGFALAGLFALVIWLPSMMRAPDDAALRTMVFAAPADAALRGETTAPLEVAIPPETTALDLVILDPTGRVETDAKYVVTVQDVNGRSILGRAREIEPMIRTVGGIAGYGILLNVDNIVGHELVVTIHRAGARDDRWPLRRTFQFKRSAP
jgi:hypothetical protein